MPVTWHPLSSIGKLRIKGSTRRMSVRDDPIRLPLDSSPDPNRVRRMDQLTRLMNSAAFAATARGHVLLVWDEPHDGARRANGACAECGAGVSVDTAPPPNGIDIAGTAVAIGCSAH